ncbi:ParA family protein [Streptomyces sp. NPDC048636]|uniref:ParA family protein n=1 Tax=Streptomyces sp. NPDC048636 TaxID=3155762 RepID=UPI00342984A9
MNPMPMSAAELGIDFQLFRTVCAFASGKGGVGKTTLTGNSAVKTAAQGVPTLGIDINGQGNLRRELGYDIGDQGAGFLDSMKNGTPLVPIKNVRPNLDVVVGGPKTRELSQLFMVLAQEQGPYAAFLRLAQCLQPLLKDYRVTFIDAPPENPNLLMMCLCAARWLIAPVKCDVCSLEDALTDIANAFKAARQVNPLLELLGVVHFGSPNGATGIHDEVVEETRKHLGAHAHVFDSAIHLSVKTAKRCRERGLSARELADAKLPNDRDLGAASLALAEAHDKLTVEIMRRMKMRLEQAA